MSFNRSAVRESINAAGKASRTMAKAIVHLKDAVDERKPGRNAAIALSALAAAAVTQAIVARIKNSNAASRKETMNTTMLSLMRNPKTFEHDEEPMFI